MVEIADMLMFIDSEVAVEEVKKNVILVKSVRPLRDLYHRLRAFKPSCVSKIFPVYSFYTGEEDSAVKFFTSFLMGIPSLAGKKFYVKCEKRGTDLSCRQMEIGLGVSLKGFAEVSFHQPDFVVFLNVLDRTVFLSIMRPSGRKVSVNPYDLYIY